jgi:serine/threonine protein kinase
MTAGVGTPAYLAPEIISSEGDYSQPADVFSFGVVLFEIFANKRAFPGMNKYRIENYLIAGKRPTIPTDVLEFSRDLIEGCWSSNASTRPTFADVFAALESADYRVLPNVDSARVKEYVVGIKNLDKVCVRTPISLVPQPV